MVFELGRRTAPRYSGQMQWRAPQRGRRRPSRPGPAEPTSAPESRRSLVDPALDAALDLDGYVVVDLLAEHEVAAFRQRYERLDHAHRGDSPFSEGFHTTIYDPRPEYRRDVLDAFDEMLAPALGRLFDRHRMFVANFVLKLPHAASVPVHVDWTYLDEPRFRSVGVWCPLVDTDAQNGTLGVIARSHVDTDPLRPVNSRTYHPFEDLGPDQPAAVLLPLRAGRAVLYDSRTWHFSAPNDSDHNRLAAACAVAPAEADLHHLWLDPDGVLMRFEVTREFYLAYEVGRPPSEFPGVVDALSVSPASMPEAPGDSAGRLPASSRFRPTRWGARHEH